MKLLITAFVLTIFSCQVKHTDPAPDLITDSLSNRIDTAGPDTIKHEAGNLPEIKAERK
jgi:hypothetical protein